MTQTSWFDKTISRNQIGFLSREIVSSFQWGTTVRFSSVYCCEELSNFNMARSKCLFPLALFTYFSCPPHFRSPFFRARHQVFSSQCDIFLSTSYTSSSPLSNINGPSPNMRFTPPLRRVNWNRNKRHKMLHVFQTCLLSIGNHSWCVDQVRISHSLFLTNSTKQFIRSTVLITRTIIMNTKVSKNYNEW